MYIIAGLGNPGLKYARTRHNLGFMTVDELASRLGIRIDKKRFRAFIGEGRIAGHKVILVKPQTYMNLSGDSVREVFDYYKPEHDHLIVVYDDFDIPEGSVRIRPFGSAGTHNGMRSIVRLLGTDRFPRVRIGTGKTDMESRELVGFVLGGFSKDEVSIMENAVDLARDACICWLDNGIDLTMNRYNVRKTKKKKEPAEQAET